MFFPKKFIKIKTIVSIFTIVFLYASFTVSSQELLKNNSSEISPNNQCFINFKSLQKAFTNTPADYTLISGDNNGVNPFTLSHRNKDNHSYSIWKTLNGEILGYFLRDNGGFDFNQDRKAVSPLSWHPTLIFDRLFNKNTILNNYSCMIAGRTRLSGRKVSMLRLAPQEDLRYSFVVARDEDTALPVELMVINPSGILVFKVTVTAIDEPKFEDFSYNDEIFDRFELLKKSETKNLSNPWSILNIPQEFSFVDEGYVVMDNVQVPFQTFSDGLVDFRVYKNNPSSLFVPSASNGTLTVLRRSDINHEYAIVGEVPIQLAEMVLKRIPASR